jgi:hypothetical protein
LLHQLSLDPRTAGSLDSQYLDWLGKLSRSVQTSMRLQVDPDPGDEPVGPLILRGISINSERTKDLKELADSELSELDCTLHLAGMEFIGDKERGLSAPPPPRPGSSATASTPRP